MDSFIKVLQIIYYIIWIPLGLVLAAVIIYMIVANPFSKMMGGFGGPPGNFGGPADFGPPGGNFGQDAPSQETPPSGQKR